MVIAIIGTGYVGLVTGACFAEMGNTVICVDSDADKIKRLRRGVMPIYEPGLQEMVSRAAENNSISFTADTGEALKKSSLCFICVGTPMSPDGGADLSHVMQAARQIGENMLRDMIIVNKSTVPAGTAGKVWETVMEAVAARGESYACRVVSNPEFLKEGAAVADCMSPDRVVIGVPDGECAEIMKDLYSPFVRSSDRFIVMDVKSAEMTKYASNAMLAARVSFMNEIAGICEAVGADVNSVRLGMGADRRIGYDFLYAGCGYGGSCFPKDVQALIKTARDNGCGFGILEQVEAVNRRQKGLLAEKAAAYFGGGGLEGRVFAVWGLAFKPNTDDIREAPAISVIKKLLREGASVRAYDPKAMVPGREIFAGETRVVFARNKYDALDGADAMLLLTEWKEFRSPDFGEMKRRMKTPLIFDGRNQYKPQALAREGFKYYQIGVGYNS